MTNKSRIQYTVDEAVQEIGNRFDLILVAAIRARELKNGHSPKVNSTDGSIVTALQEIEAGHIKRDYLKKIKK
jgi:DNA-directed RNA polymerase subunit omega